ncbi:hypothetical protein BsWGS_28713 [Bradybaena similaris]
MQNTHLILGLAFLASSFIQRSEGHGYMLDPPGRSSMWRKGFPTPINWDDNGVRCDISERNCRVCGNRDNEAGGRYATGTIAKTYTQGQTITITLIITVNHKGYFEFSLCPNNNVHKAVTEACLQRYVLQQEGGKTKYELKPGVTGEITIKAKLPPTVTCSQCVLRWFWKTGHSWGVEPSTRFGCIGCGEQERFFGCADISIVPGRQQMADRSLESDQPFGDAAPFTDNTTRTDFDDDSE